MLAGAWGARAGELLERAGQWREGEIHRVGALAMLEHPHLTKGRWCCWIFGEPEGLTAFAGAFGEEGAAAYELLSGRFVVVALDRERDRCLVTRDQLGAQPLIHGRAGDGVLFGEHERDLLELLPRTPGVDRLALLQWVDTGLTPRGRTLYEGLERLRAGHRLILENAQARVERWWDIRYRETESGSGEALAGFLREQAFAAVARAAAGSGRPAVKLSGGLDSACVAAGLAADGFADGRGLAIGGTFSTHPETDESELIEATARHTHLPLERIEFDPSSSMLAPALAHIARWRLPPASPNLFVWEPVMARARALGVDLMLDGEGGDELFGLAPYLIADMVRAGRLGTAWRLTGRIPGIGLDPSRRLRVRVLRRFGLSPFLPVAVKRGRERRASAESSGAIVPRGDAHALVELALASHSERRDGPWWWRFKAESLIDERDLLDVGGHFRREAADESIERRHPFLYDLGLTEAVLRIPPRAQFDPIRNRPLLRDGLAGLIPEAVRTRHAKSHFTPLLLAGNRADEAGLIEPLRHPDAPVRGYVAEEPLERKLGVAPEERAMRGALSLWRVAIVNRWLLSLAGEG
jgi:asparagine synthetase B (glutamine-hydrolysing)